MRDTQRKRVYRAEHVLDVGPGGERLETTEEIQGYLMKLSRCAWFRKRWPGHARLVAARGYIVKDGRGRRGAGAWGRRSMTVPRWARTKGTVLHELAHLLAPSGAHHGWEYAATMRLLVRFALGKDEEARLLAAYKAEGVRYKKPRKRVPLTPERRAELRARIIRLHAARAAKARPVEVTDSTGHLFTRRLGVQ